MIKKLRYEAGRETSQLYAVSLNLHEANLDEARADLVARFVEFWCQANCSGSWRVEETNKRLNVSFALSRDFIAFKLSNEYAEFDAGWQRVEDPDLLT